MPFNNSPRLLQIRLLSSLSNLQLVQNADARLLSGNVTRKYEPVTPTLLSAVHWSPIKYRIDFKIILFVYKALNNLALSTWPSSIHPI